jgi:hypothetical protein
MFTLLSPSPTTSPVLLMPSPLVDKTCSTLQFSDFVEEEKKKEKTRHFSCLR